MFKIGVDMDGTVVDFTTASFKRVEELYGIKMTKEDAYKPKTAQLVWERMTDEQKSKFTDHRELYADICNRGFFRDLEPFPGAVEGIKELYESGMKIIIITKVLNWDRSAPEKKEWLEKYLGDIEYTVLMVESVYAKQLVSVDIIIDDDPKVIESVDGAIPIMVAQPWNRESRSRQTYVVETFANAVPLVKAMKEVHETAEEILNR